jgi:hypothetical protein
MSIFQKAENRQAFLKAGIMGLAGSGKTYTASEIAIGLVEYMRDRLPEVAARPVAFMDTETGSDWALPRFQAANIEMVVNRSRSLWDLRQAIIEAERECSVLIIDSITHFWTVFCDEYAERKGRKRGLEFADWAFLKKEWRVFTDLFVNSQLHIIMCGRQGYEYDFFENASGKKELIKTGVKMKAETETGFEPSILIAMEQQQEMVQGEVIGIARVAKILKDRSTLLDGKEIRNPTFKDFLPHIQCLNLGHEHAAIEKRDNRELFTDDGRSKWERDQQQKEIALDEIKSLLDKHHGGSTASAKESRAALFEEVFGTRSQARFESLGWPIIEKGRNAIWLKLEGVPYAFVPPATAPAILPETVGE